MHDHPCSVREVMHGHPCSVREVMHDHPCSVREALGGRKRGCVYRGGSPSLNTKFCQRFCEEIKQVYMFSIGL